MKIIDTHIMYLSLSDESSKSGSYFMSVTSSAVDTLMMSSKSTTGSIEGGTTGPTGAACFGKLH